MTRFRAPTLSHYPQGTYLVEDVLKRVCGEQGGITQSLLVSPVRYSEDLAIKSIVAQMPGYHRVLRDPHLEMQYHLSGYGVFYEEALIRLAGEAIERYSLMVAQNTLADQIRYATYREMAREGRVLPLELLRLFSDADYERLGRGHFRGMQRLEPDDVVGWLRCGSLFDPSQDIWAPAQMLLVGYRLSRDHREVPFTPAFSTGTAAHVSVARALQNALLEAIEIDALMLHWYTDLRAPVVEVDDTAIASLTPDLFGAHCRHEVLALNIRVLEEVEAHALAVALIHKQRERPYIVLGAQGHLDPRRGVYRGLMETIAIAFLGIYGPLFMPEEYLVSTQGSVFTDLDRNVGYFADPADADTKRAVLDRMCGGHQALSTLPNFETGDAEHDTARLIRQLAAVSEYGLFLDVTPPETRPLGWHVVRTFLPELVTMCVPGVPYSHHPRMQRYGGITNEYPHPLP